MAEPPDFRALYRVMVLQDSLKLVGAEGRERYHRSQHSVKILVKAVVPEFATFSAYLVGPPRLGGKRRAKTDKTVRDAEDR